jgi:transcription elongation factor Elf1
MDNKNGVGSLNCRLCAASYQMPIHHLHEPIDVFSEWLDDCEAAANGGRAPGADAANQGEGAAPRFNEEDDEDDDDLPQSVDLSGRNKKRPAQDTGVRKKQKTGGKDESKTITDLGLEDSETGSDED